MDSSGYIEIRISGSRANGALTPDNFDIRELTDVLESAEDLLFPAAGGKRDRPVISYEMAEGSVRNILKTSIQYIIGFDAVLGQIVQQQNIDFLDLPTAKAIEHFQEIAVKQGFAFHISTSVSNTNLLSIDPDTSFRRSEGKWANTELYFYGKITNAGGKDRANIHIHTEEFGLVRIATPIAVLEEQEQNFLYKTFGVRALGLQNLRTGEIDLTKLSYLGMTEFGSAADQSYLDSLREKAGRSWAAQLKADQFINEIRGYEA